MIVTMAITAGMCTLAILFLNISCDILFSDRLHATELFHTALHYTTPTLVYYQHFYLFTKQYYYALLTVIVMNLYFYSYCVL